MDNQIKAAIIGAIGLIIATSLAFIPQYVNRSDTLEMTATVYNKSEWTGLEPSGLTLDYNYFEENGILYIEHHMAYLDSLSQGGPIKGIRYDCRPFNWSYPEISIKTVNNKKETVLLTEVVVVVESSEVNLEPVLVIHDHSTDGYLTIVNNGWGEVKNATINLSIRPSDSYGHLDPGGEGLDHAINLGTFLEYQEINITPYVPSDIGFEDDMEVSVIGKILYQTEKEENRSLWFKTRVILDSPPEAPAPPSEYKSLFLKAGKSGYKERVPISQCLSPGEVDHFVICIESDRSSKFSPSLSFRDESGNEIYKEKLYLDSLPAAPAPPSEYKSLFLKAGKSGYEERVPISQYLSPGEVDHFVIRIKSDRSSKFNLSFSFRKSGNEIYKEKLCLDIFVPRYNSNW